VKLEVLADESLPRTGRDAPRTAIST
jgi:hypothetical protein